MAHRVQFQRGRTERLSWQQCKHDSASGGSDSGEWTCDECGQVTREVLDPTGPSKVFEPGGMQYSVRDEVISPGRARRLPGRERKRW